MDKQQGFSLVGVIIAVAVAITMASVAATISGKLSKRANLQAIIQLQAIAIDNYARAVDAWVETQSDSWGPRTKHTIRNGDLVSAGHLPAGTVFTSPFGGSLKAVAYKDAEGVVRIVIGETATDDIESLGSYDLPVSMAGLEQMKRRVAKAVTLGGIPAGVLPAGATTAQGYRGFTLDTRRYISGLMQPITVVFLGFDELSGYVPNETEDDSVMITPYTFGDIAKGLEKNGAGFRLMYEFSGVGPYVMQRSVSSSVPDVEFKIFGETIGGTPQLGITITCNTAEKSSGNDHYEGRCKKSATQYVTLENQTAAIELGWVADVNTKSCGTSSPCIYVNTIKLSISDINMDGLTLKTVKTFSSNYWGYSWVKNAWRRLTTFPIENSSSTTTTTTSFRYYWETL